MKPVYVHACLCLSVAARRADLESYAPEARGRSKKSWLLNVDDSPGHHLDPQRADTNHSGHFKLAVAPRGAFVF